MRAFAPARTDHGFFGENNLPKSNFRKIMHIHVTDSIIARYKEVKFVWAHVGVANTAVRMSVRMRNLIL